MTISIIIATYNAAKTLEKCLASIVPQMNSETELIIIDGLSNDSTMDILSKYNQISYTISEPDKGIYDAWNKGIKASHGNWIMFVGADDVLLPDAIKTYFKMIDQTPDIDKYDYICAHNLFVDKNSKLLKIIGDRPVWAKMKKNMSAAHVASLHNRENLFETVGLYNLSYKICADYELLIRKKDKLKYLFVDKNIAAMKAGGMSFSTKAIIEVYKIRKTNHTVPLANNLLLFLRDWIAFKLFVFRNFVKGKKF